MSTIKGFWENFLVTNTRAHPQTDLSVCCTLTRKVPSNQRPECWPAKREFIMRHELNKLEIIKYIAIILCNLIKSGPFEFF